jgi:hypothetical protein
LVKTFGIRYWQHPFCRLHHPCWHPEKAAQDYKIANVVNEAVRIDKNNQFMSGRQCSPYQSFPFAGILLLYQIKQTLSVRFRRTNTSYAVNSFP